MSTPAIPQDVLDALLTATTALATALVDATDALTPPEPPRTFQRGDAVEITGFSEYGSDNIGMTGVVGNPRYAGGTVEVFVGGVHFVYAPSNLEKVAAKPTSAAAYEVTIAHGSREIRVRPSFATGGARIHLHNASRPGADSANIVHLTAAQTATLAATLTAITDQ